MSVSFYVGNPHRAVASCDACLTADHPDEPPDTTCEFCHGTGQCERLVWPLEPPLNMANDNAAAILRLVDPKQANSPEGLVGGWEVEQLPAVRRRIVEVLNRPRVLETETREPEQEWGARRVVREEGEPPRIERHLRWSYGGRDVEYLERRLRDLLGVVTFSQEHGYHVYWG